MQGVGCYRLNVISKCEIKISTNTHHGTCPVAHSTMPIIHHTGAHMFIFLILIVFSFQHPTKWCSLSSFRRKLTLGVRCTQPLPRYPFRVGWWDCLRQFLLSHPRQTHLSPCVVNPAEVSNRLHHIPLPYRPSHLHGLHRRHWWLAKRETRLKQPWAVYENPKG